MEKDFNAFFRSLDPDTREVIRRMDDHESLGHTDDSEVSQQLVSMLASVHEKLTTIVDQLSEGGANAERHAETMLLIMSYAPNAQSYWFVKQLVENRPDVYEYLYTKVLSQKPLQMYGKLLRERLMFYLAREQIVNTVFSPASRITLITALEAIKRV